MSPLLTWLTTAPQGAIAILTATIAAVVAVLVVLLTQWILGRRARTDLLRKKLEELYLTINEVSAHNVKRVEELLPHTTNGLHSSHNPTSSSVERYALNLHKKIIMLVRLYFPKLSAAHQLVYRRNNRVNELVHKIERGIPETEKLMRLSGAYGDALAAMEREIIINMRILTKDGFLPRRYRTKR